MQNTNNQSVSGSSLPTLNRCGRTSTIPNEYSQQFIDFSACCSEPVLDIGAAFGVATIPALRNGAKVTAVDIDEAQLQMLGSSTPEDLKPNLTIVKARFPFEVDLRDNCFQAVHASNLLNFLSGEELLAGLKRIFDWLIPGGKVFFIAGTPYARNVQNFIAIYEERVNAGVRWPGEIAHLPDYSDDPTISELPPFIHLLDDLVLQRAMEEAGLQVERIELYKRANLPDYIAFDGRENVGAIGFKPL